MDLEEGETVTLKPLLPAKFKDATLSWGLGTARCGHQRPWQSTTLPANSLDWDQIN